MKVLPEAWRLDAAKAARAAAHRRYGERAKREAPAGVTRESNGFYAYGCHALADLRDLRACNPEPISGTGTADFRGRPVVAKGAEW